MMQRIHAHMGLIKGPSSLVFFDRTIMHKQITAALDKDVEFVFKLLEGVPMGCGAAPTCTGAQSLTTLCQPMAITY